MPTLADLNRAVKTTLASGRLGVPVFVRLILQGQDGPDAIVPRLARLSALAQDWLGQQATRLYAVGSPEAGQVSLTWQFEKGATASVSYARSPVRGDGLNVMVLGNHGAIYHDAGDADLWDEAVQFNIDTQPDLRGVIERGVTTGKPEPVSRSP